MQDTLTTNSRLKGMIWGQFLGDAASLGAHWIYSLEDLKKTFPEGIRGFETPQPDHYHAGKQSGDQTHYGDAALVLLQSVAAQSTFDEKHFGAAWFSSMTPESGYTGYFDGASKGTLENKATFQKQTPDRDFDFQQGANDDQLATISSLAPVVAVHHSSSDLESFVERATKVRQNNPTAIAFNIAHSKLLLQLLSGNAIEQSIRSVQSEMETHSPQGKKVTQRIEAALQSSEKTIEAATKELGQSCPLTGSVPSALVAFVQNPTDFKAAILSTIRAGGDQAGRAAMLGAWLGAHLGYEALPQDWLSKLTAHPKIEAATDKILS